MRLSCAASSNFSRGDIGGSCVLALTAPKLGTTHNIRLVCLPWESSRLSCGHGAWSGTEAGPLRNGGAETELLGGVGFCGESSRALDWFAICVCDQATEGQRRTTRTRISPMISSKAFSELCTCRVFTDHPIRKVLIFSVYTTNSRTKRLSQGTCSSNVLQHSFFDSHCVRRFNDSRPRPKLALQSCSIIPRDQAAFRQDRLVPQTFFCP